MNIALEFNEDDRLGRVSAVDTSRVFIDVENHTLLTRTAVGNLLAVRGQTQHEYLICIIERVQRGSTGEIFLEGLEDSEELNTGLDDNVRAVLVGTYRTVDGEKTDVFKRGSDSFPQVDREAFLIGSGNLQNLMSLIAKEIKPEERLQLGKFASDGLSLAVANGDKFFQRHAAILGSTGSGKSWAVALILEKSANLNFPNLIVFDMHGEYTTLSRKTGGYAELFKIAGPGDLEKPSESELFLPYWLLSRDEMLAMLLDRSDNNAPNQASRFTSHIKDLKSSTVKDKIEIAQSFTVDSPIPYNIDELIQKLVDDDSEMVPGKSGPKQGPWYGKLSRFISRLEAKISDRRYGFMFKPPIKSQSYEWLGEFSRSLLKSGVKVIDFSEVPPDILPIVAGLLMRILYDIQFWMTAEKRTPIAFVCDEAHLYLPVKHDADSAERRALEAFERVAKEGRKYGVGLVVVSQRPSDVSRTILSQCNNFLVLRLTNNEDQAVVKHLVPDSLSGLTQLLPLLDTGEAILLGDAILLPARIKLDKPQTPPASATRDFWGEWSLYASNEDAILTAVENLRRQSRE